MNKLKTLILDIETSPMEVYVFGLKEQNIGLNQIKKDIHIMAWSAKWLDAAPSTIVYKETRTGNDKQIVRALWKLLDEAEIVITQNGKSFDGPIIEARMMLHGMKPPSPYRHHDTYLQNKNKRFTSHKLEYLTTHLNDKYKKLAHEGFPGFALWTECLKGNQKAWEAMKKYNIHDVLSTEELYHKTKAWANKNAPDVYTTAGQCGMCEGKVYKRGLGVNKSGRYHRLHCQKCGRWSMGDKVK